MAKEIERKFLIDQKILRSLENGLLIKQGYIATKDKTTVRIRIKGESAYLTIKGKNLGMTRSEFEYQIPMPDAEQMLVEFCDCPIVEKIRYEHFHAGHTWEIDIFHGDNEGLVVAEVELLSEHEKVELPVWIKKEVTGDPKYYNINLLSHPYKNWH